ncbi:MAG: DNA polymerase III subunit delta [Actinomycetota bacterium]|nr:DNA polymerase III subunit delta [Actinomycetota bacterium]
MATFKPAYLIHGDDHGRIAERRGRLRVLAEGQSGAGGMEVLEGDAGTPAAAAAALCAMTLTTGRRFVIVDGVERWRDGDLEPVIESLSPPPPDTTVAFFAREEGRARAPERLHQAVLAAGGEVSVERTVKPWELPKWTAERARELGLTLEAGAARALVAAVGDRQQRLLRELEKLALQRGGDASLTAEAVDELAAPSAERRAWTLADALVARDAAAALRTYGALTAQGERLESLLFQMTRRVRQALEVAERLDVGEPAAQVKRSLRMPPKAAEALMGDVARSDRDVLRRALEQLADLELDARGGRPVPRETAAVRTIMRLAA